MDVEADVEKLVAAGLYDPDAPAAADRLALLQYLTDEGATIDEMVESARNGNLTGLVTDQRLQRGSLSANDLAERVGVPVDQVIEVFRLLGVAVPHVDDLIFDAREVQLELMEHTGVAIPAGMGDEILRAIGTASRSWPSPRWLRSSAASRTSSTSRAASSTGPR